MALTITEVANQVRATSGANIVTGATITAAVGDWLVALIGCANSGTAGAAAITASSCSDSGGNTWTNRGIINWTIGGAAGDGATLGMYTAPITNALGGTGTVTIAFSPNVAQAGLTVYRVQPGAGEIVAFRSSDTTGLTGSGTNHPAPTVSVPNGDTIFAAASIETNEVLTGATDTTNGSWSTLVQWLGSGGGGPASQLIAAQYKTVNATGNQSWTITTPLTRDSARSYLILGPSAAPAVSEIHQGIIIV